MQKISEWLQQIALEQYADNFSRQAIGFDVLVQLTDADMSELGIAIGDRYRLKKAIALYQSEQSLHVDQQAHYRQLTVLFSDLVGSTQLSTQLNAEKYRNVLRRYQQTVSNVMHHFGGTVTRFEGDGVMVLFGFPVAHEDVPDRAICAALDSVAAVARLTGVEQANLQSRIGIATGEVVVGDQFGVGLSRHFGVSGSTPNLAARLQALAVPDGIVASATTMRLTKSAFRSTRLPPTTVKGIAEPIQAFVVNGEQQTDDLLANGPTNKARLIARNSEFNQLKHNWQTASSGKGMVTILLGEAGIGKTRLVQELIQKLPVDEVLRFHCLPRYQNSMLHPLIQQLRDSTCLSRLSVGSVLRDHVVNLNLPGVDVDANQNTLKDFESLLDLLTDTSTDNTVKIKKNQIFSAVLLQLRNLVESGVSVVVVEDVHWADPTSLDLLTEIVEIIEELPLLLLLTTRPEKIPIFDSSSAVNTVKLSALTMSDSTALIEQVTEAKLLSTQDISSILDRCDGIPLYLEEITRAVMEEVDVSLLERHSDNIPETLRDLLMARLDRLGSGTVLAQIASVLGRKFTVSQVKAIADISHAAVEDGLVELEKAGVLVAISGESEQSYQFNHSLTANAAYTSLLSEHKQLLHAKVARMLDADPLSAEREPETAAGHYEWAGELEPAIRLRELAANRASVRSANVEAAFHFNKAAELAIQLPVDAQRDMLELRLRLELGTQLIACYGNAAPQVKSNFERAQELCESVPDQPLLWQTLYGLWSIYQVNGQLREANTLGQQLIDLAKRLNSSDLSLRAHRAHGLCQFAMGKFDASRIHLQCAVDIYNPEKHGVRQMGDISDNLVLANCNLGWLYCFQGETEQGLYLHKKAICRAEELQDQHSLAFALALSAASHQALGDHANTGLLAQRLVTLSQAHGFPYWLAWGEMLHEWARCANVVSVYTDDFDKALSAYEETGGRMMNAYFITLRAELEIAHQLLPQAIATLNEAEKLIDETATQFYMAEIPRLRAEIDMKRGMADDSEKMLALADRLAIRQGNLLLKRKIDNTKLRLPMIQCKLPVL